MAENSKTDIAVLKTELVAIKDTIGEIKEIIQAHIELCQREHARMENKFAAKWVEKAIFATAGTILVSVLGAMMSLILTK